ncbi:MAG: sodium:solute symporter family protein [Acidobacteria bacterium]|nr:sodium:solute symporter family protein [Acidobacteriota bacterium]
MVFAAYIAAVLAIGRFTSRRIGTAEDFHLCGRSLGRLPAALSLAATEFSGSGLIGGAGLAYAIGISGAYWNLVAVPAWIAVGLTATVTLRKLSLTTIPGYLGERYGISSRRLVAVLQMTEAVVFTAVQIQVSAIALSALFGLDRTFAECLVTGVFVAYTAMGGLWAVVWTDVLQYAILMSGVLVGLPLALERVGWIDGLRASLPASHFSLAQLGVMEPLAWMALCVYSYSTDQTYMQRVFASSDARVARFAYLYTGFNYLVFGTCVAGMGMVASVLLPGLPHQDEALPVLIKDVLPAGLRGFFLTAILATTMSTASAWLAAAASLFVQDIYEPLCGGHLEERPLLSLSRWTMIGVAAGSLAIAHWAPGVVNAVVFSTLVAPAAVFAPMMLGLYWRRIDRRAGFWALLVGAVAGVGSQVFLYGRAGGALRDLHPLFFGPGAGLLVLLGISLLRRGAAR